MAGVSFNSTRGPGFDISARHAVVLRSILNAAKSS